MNLFNDRPLSALGWLPGACGCVLQYSQVWLLGGFCNGQWAIVLTVKLIARVVTYQTASTLYWLVNCFLYHYTKFNLFSVQFFCVCDLMYVLHQIRCCWHTIIKQSICGDMYPYLSYICFCSRLIHVYVYYSCIYIMYIYIRTYI